MSLPENTQKRHHIAGISALRSTIWAKHYRKIIEFLSNPTQGN